MALVATDQVPIYTPGWREVCASTLPKDMRGEWPSGLYSLRQVAEVKLGRVRSDFGWVTSEA